MVTGSGASSLGTHFKSPNLISAYSAKLQRNLTGGQYEKTLNTESHQPGLSRKSKPTGTIRPGWTVLGNGLLMLLLALGICSNPSIQRGPSVSQAEQAHPNCRAILFDETHSGFKNPSPSFKRRDGSTMGIRQEESTWEVPFLNALSGTLPGTDASRFWRFGKSSLLVQMAANSAVSLFSGRITMQLPFADLFLQDCEREQQFTSVLGLLGH